MDIGHGHMTIVSFVSPVELKLAGKTICQRAKARMWATDNPSKKLFFCVVRESYTANATLLALELRLYFREHKCAKCDCTRPPL